MPRRTEAGRWETGAEYRGEVSRGHSRVGDGEEPESQPKARTVFREELEREE